MASFTLKSTIAAPPEIVFDVLTDHRRYAEITPLRSSTLEREGVPAPNGVGAIRALGLVGPPLREETIEYERPSRFVYRLLSGAPVRDHVGTVELSPVDGGTQVHYHLDTTPTVPVGRAIVANVTKLGIGQLLKGIAREAERRAAAAN
jgi:uncharacterized protein YndB with AHSA1/START domain